MSLVDFFLKISEETDFAEEAMSQCTNELRQYANFTAGHFFLAPDPLRPEMLSSKNWNFANPEAGEKLSQLVKASEDVRVVWGADLPGRVMASGNPEWFAMADQLPECPRMTLAREAGIRSAFAFPVVFGNEVVGVSELFSDSERPAERELIEISRLVGRRISRVIERDGSALELARARQDALDASIAKSNFLAQVSHEIRTPLNAILGMSHLLLSSRLEEEQSDYADSIRTSAQSLLRIVNDILDISKIEAGKFEIQSGDFQIGTLIKDTLAMLAHLAQGKGVELSSHVDPDLPPTLRGDAGRLRQVLLNLVGNAIKFTDRGNVAIRVLSEDRSTGSVKVRFEVEDSGIGIPESLHSKLFDVFTQADNTASRRYGGTGLGLSISKRLVELMGGEIGFHSQEGVGSIFWFSLALEDALTSESPRITRPSRATKLTTAGRHSALVVEDNPINLKVMMRMLQGFGLEVSAAASGPEAIASVQKQKFDLIFMDCQMPGMDGYEATREIRRWESESTRHQIPIIAVTANVIKGDRERCLSAGMNDYLTKPIDPDRLAVRLRYWLSQAEDFDGLDTEALHRIRGMNVKGESDFLEELVILFRDSSPARIQRIREAIQNEDGTMLSREAHYLKSSSANLGARQLSSLCQKLDEMGRLSQFDGATDTLEMLERAYKTACTALERELQAQPS